MKVLFISTHLNVKERVLSYLLVNDGYTVDLHINNVSDRKETLFSNKKLTIKKDNLLLDNFVNLLDNALLKYDFIILSKALLDLSDVNKLSLNRKQNITKSIFFFINDINEKENYLSNNDLYYLCQTGILNNLNWFNSQPLDKEYHIPKNHFIIEIVMKCFLIAASLNFRSLNKRVSSTVIEPINTLNNLAYYLHSAFNLNNHNRLIKIEESGYFPEFDKEHYNIFRTKDNNYFTLGNLEKKFRKDFTGNLPKEYSNKVYNYDVIKEICENTTLDNLEKRFVNDKNCSSPVLNIEEAKEFHDHMSNKQLKSRDICDIQQFLFGKRENLGLVIKF